MDSLEAQKQSLVKGAEQVNKRASSSCCCCCHTPPGAYQRRVVLMEPACVPACWWCGLLVMDG